MYTLCRVSINKLHKQDFQECTGFNIRLLSRTHRKGLKKVTETSFVPLRASRMRAGLEVGLVPQSVPCDHLHQLLLSATHKAKKK